MVNTPLRPRSSSLRLRFISVVNLFILSLSWRVGRNNGRSLLKHSGRMILLKRMLNLVQFWDNQKKITNILSWLLHECHLKADDNIWGLVLTLGHHLMQAERVGHFLKDVVHNCLHLLLSRGRGTPSISRLSRLKLENRLEKFLRGRRQESNFRVGVQAVQVGRLLG